MPLQIVRNDITKMEVDAIVNTTNAEMIGYSGVDYAVHSAAGKEFDEECGRLAPIAEGTAVVTSGYGLPAKYVIHTCGPVWKGGDSHEEEQLESCYVACLLQAMEMNCETVAFPLISSGAYGYPKDRVLSLAVKIITEFLLDMDKEENDMTVYLCVYDRDSYELSRKLFKNVREYIDDNYVECGTEYYEPCCGTMLSEVCPCENIQIPDSRKAKRDTGRKKTNDACLEPNNKLDVVFVNKADRKQLKKEIFKLDIGFAEMLFKLIDSKGMTDVECYKKANVSRKTFSKIRSDRHYRPAKETAIAFAIALRLTLDETEKLLKTAGFALSNSNYFDVIVEYFIKSGEYDVFKINEVLFEYDQTLLG